MKGICLGLLLLLPLAGLGADTLSPGEFARQIHAEINAIRGRNGLPELIWRDDLAGLALRHSQNMGKQDFFNHVDPEGLQVSQRLRKHLPELLVAGVGENLYFIENSRLVFDPREIALGWLNSTGHKANILSQDFTHEGIAVHLEGNRLYTTQVLALPILKRISALPPAFSAGRSYALEFEYVSVEPREGFNCQLSIPDPNARVQIDLLTYTLGSMPLNIEWKGENRLILPLEFKYGKGRYSLQLGWDGYYYQDMLEFRAD